MPLHFRDPRTSPQLRRLLEAFSMGNKLTTLQIIALGSCSPSTAVAELRTWMDRHHPTQTISRGKFERTTERKSKVYSYKMVPKEPGAAFEPAPPLTGSETRRLPGQSELFLEGANSLG